MCCYELGTWSLLYLTPIYCETSGISTKTVEADDLGCLSTMPSPSIHTKVWLRIERISQTTASQQMLCLHEPRLLDASCQLQFKSAAITRRWLHLMMYKHVEEGKKLRMHSLWGLFCGCSSFWPMLVFLWIKHDFELKSLLLGLTADISMMAA